MVFEAETCSTPATAWVADQSQPDKWALWSTDEVSRTATSSMAATSHTVAGHGPVATKPVLPKSLPRATTVVG